MRPSLYEVYVHLVALAALAGGVVCVLGGLYAAIGVVVPDWLMRDHAWAYHQTNDRYWEWIGRGRETNAGWVGGPTRPPEDELTRRRLESLEVERGAVRRDGWVALVMYGAGLAISVVLFRVHWRLARAFRPPREPSAGAVPPA
jgi:hypothetical protein